MKLADITVTPLRRISTDGGDVLHAMKQSDVGYEGFGEAYFSWISKGAVKGWKRHTQMTMNLVVPVGRVRFVFCEIHSVADCDFRIEEIGEEHYARITVPSGIWFGFQGLDTSPSLVLNIASIIHNPSEVERQALSEIYYVWK